MSENVLNFSELQLLAKNLEEKEKELEAWEIELERKENALKKTMDGLSFINGYRLNSGDCFI